MGLITQYVNSQISAGSCNSPNPDFIRQLAAFQMLRDQFRLKLTGENAPSGATGANRTYLLSLWEGPAAIHWHWVVRHLIEESPGTRNAVTNASIVD